ncbi:MAG: hypothetical protein WD492_09060 [Alkalispirochaeta sp.]
MADFTQFQALFGDIHNHCGISYAHGTLQDALENAALRLDFTSVTGHAAWPDMPVDDERVAHIVDFHVKGFARLQEGWDSYQEEIAAFENQRGLIVFPGYEIHSNDHGDYTVMGYRHELPLLTADTPMELQRVLSESIPPTDIDSAGRVLPGTLTFPHHIGYRIGARGGNWESFTEELSPIVEIASMHGLAEADRTDHPFLHSMGPLQHRGTMWEGLEQGHRFGVLGNTDHHSAHPGSYGHGITGIWATDRSRAAVWEALYARRTWANTGDSVSLWHSVNDVPLGGEVSREDRYRHWIEIDSPSAIDYVELVDSGGRTMVWWRPPQPSESRQAPTPQHVHETAGTDTPGNAATDAHAPGPHPPDTEAIVHIDLGWGERGKRYDWDGTVEVSGSELQDVVPRFRGQEVVSPLDASDNQVPLHNASWSRSSDHSVAFQCTTWGNMTNTTPSTQGFDLRVSDASNARIRFRTGDIDREYAVADLIRGSESGNLGPIDSPAFRLSADSRPACTWSITWDEDHPRPGNRWYYVRVRLKNGHWSISSPVFVG